MYTLYFDMMQNLTRYCLTNRKLSIETAFTCNSVTIKWKQKNEYFNDICSFLIILDII